MFVRTNIPLRHQIVQSNHAVLHMAALYFPSVDSIPNIVAIGVPNVRSLERALDKLRVAGIPHYQWIEPDFNLGFTSICTIPIGGVQRACLADYRLWDDKNTVPVVSNSTAPSKGAGLGANPSGSAMEPGGRQLTALEWDGSTNFDASVAQVKSTRLLAERSLVDKPAGCSNAGANASVAGFNADPAPICETMVRKI